ncbi:MAG: HD-GYP domain-containing protein [Lachnospiraceae bacterium]|nr:HD-GYP domain-containing protein [Lachnospiraceae bacterium]
MSIVNIKDLVPGMITEEPVKTRSGQLIVNEGVTLDRRLIERLDFYSIKEIKVKASELDQKQIEEEKAAALLAEETARRLAEEAAAKEAENLRAAQMAAMEAAAREAEAAKKAKADEGTGSLEDLFRKSSTATYTQKVVMSDKFKAFQISYSMTTTKLKDAFDAYQESHTLAPKTLMMEILEILNEQKFNTIELFDMLHNIKTVEDSIYAHCINVAYIARVIGKWMKFDHDIVDDLTIAGLFHDIGKTLIPKDILDKPGKLTPQEYEIVKMHSKMGYDLLISSGLNARILNAILNHHERCDGSGYPNGIDGSKIDDFTMIIAVADVYDAMTSARSYRHSLCPFKVIANFEDEGLQKYRPSVILTFLSKIANSYQNNRVRLSDNSIGNIVLLNDKQLSRPIIQLNDGSFIDLTTRSDLSIEAIL